ncbi:MAG: glycosyltransferase family 39 protein, partial [Chloroflexota bacterium]|nr:glycosyltransferase family 39 protein [Chloroflexota bacterium]
MAARLPEFLARRRLQRLAQLRPLNYIIQQSFTREPNPPLYFLLLHAWRYAAGSSEYAIRFLSLAPAVVVVPLLFAIGRRLSNLKLGLAAAALGAGSP